MNYRIAASKTAALTAWRLPNTAIGDPLRAILDCEFVVGNSGQEFILHRLYFTYLLYHKFFIFSTNYPYATLLFLVSVAGIEPAMDIMSRD